jgi:uncharacterized protein YigE (DUF2233 family)
MRTRSKARTIAFLLAAVTSLLDHDNSAVAQAQACRSKEHAHNAYTVCEVNLARHTVRLYWKRSDGTPYANQLMIIAHCPPADFEKMLSLRRANHSDG